MVVTPLLMHLSITFSNQRFSSCSPTMDVGFVKLTLGSFYGNKVFTVNIQFCCHLCCSSCAIFRNNPSRCTTISLCQCWFLPTIPLRCCFSMIHICRRILKTLSFPIQLIMLQLVVTDAPATRAPTICPLSKSDKCPIFWFFHMDFHSAQSLMHLHKQYKV
jgi:hypothetical protein